MTAQIDERTLDTDILEDLREGIARLEEERDMLDWRIEEKRARLRAYESKHGIVTAVPTEQRKRAPRGANLKAIISLLQDPASPRQGLTTAEIVSKTKLSFSSVQAALKQGVEGGVVQQIDGFWRPIPEAKASDSDISEMARRNGTVN